MSLYIKEKVFSWNDVFHAYDEAGNVRYTVEGEVFSWGKKLHIYDHTGRECAFIQQKLFTFLPRYEILQNGCVVAEVVKDFTLFTQKYTVHGPEWNVHGAFWYHDYEISHGNQQVATVSKQWFTLGDAYELRIFESVDPALALAVVLVIDACIDASTQ